VRVGINSYLEAEDAFVQMQKIEGFQQVLIQEMIKGYELIIGTKRDPVFGPVIVIGLGGVLTNLIHETERLISPVSYAYT
jgi:acyl-CoA synthetase (NDP forming)